MALAADASSPPRVSADATTVTTASFTPPAASLLIACTSASGNTPANATITITGSPTLTWTQVNIANPTTTGAGAAIGGGVATMHYAVAASSVATTVTATQVNGSNPTSLKVYVLTGARNSSPLGATSLLGYSSANDTTTSPITTTIPGSWVFCSSTDWQVPGTPPSSANLVADPYAFTGATTSLDGISGYIPVATAGTAQTCDLDLAGTGIAQWEYLVAEIIPGAIDYTANPADGVNAGDRLPPVPPDGVTAIAVSQTEVDLSWYGVAGAKAYDLERNGTVIATGVTGGTYQDTGLLLGTTYTYNVRSVY